MYIHRPACPLPLLHPPPMRECVCVGRGGIGIEGLRLIEEGMIVKGRKRERKGEGGVELLCGRERGREIRVGRERNERKRELACVRVYVCVCV